LLLLVRHYCKHIADLAKPEFRGKYGAALEGTTLKSEKSILLFPMAFFARRILFVLSAILLKEVVWAQLALQTAVSLTMIIYLLWSRPLDSRFATWMGVMNEETALFLTYAQMCFTDFVPEPVTRS